MFINILNDVKIDLYDKHLTILACPEAPIGNPSTSGCHKIGYKGGFQMLEILIWLLKFLPWALHETYNNREWIIMIASHVDFNYKDFNW